MTDLDQLVNSTIKTFTSFKDFMPSLDPKYFKRPPNKSNGFAKGVFTNDQLKGIFTEKKGILAFLKKLVDYTQICLDQKIDV